MFGVREGVDRRQAAGRSERLQVGLRVGADHGPVEHPAEHAGGVLDGFAPAAELEVVAIEEECVAAEFTDADLETDPCTCRRLTENHPPAAMPERVRGVAAAGRFHLAAQGDDPQDFVAGQRLDGK